VDDRVQARLQTLRREFDTGQKQLAELDAQRSQLMEAMLRISGAIHVLEELAGERSPDDRPRPNGTPDPQDVALGPVT
jgi:prefoldin subunit 5